MGEDIILERMFKEGKTLEEVCEALNRNALAVRARRINLEDLKKEIQRYREEEE